MGLQIKAYQFKCVPTKNLVLLHNAVNVAMNEMLLDNTKKGKTLITDALATCSAVAFCGLEPGFTGAFTHLSSANTVADDQRKEIILNQMLEFMVATLPLGKIQMLVSPSPVPETYLMNFLHHWADKKAIKCQILQQGGDSAVFNIDGYGNPLLISTSLIFREKNKKCSGHGVILDSSNSALLASYFQQHMAYSSFFKDAEKNDREVGKQAVINSFLI